MSRNQFHVELDALEAFAQKLRVLVEEFEETASHAKETRLERGKIGNFSGAHMLESQYDDMLTQLHLLLNDVNLQIEDMRGNMKRVVQAYAQTDNDRAVAFRQTEQDLLPKQQYYEQYRQLEAAQQATQQMAPLVGVAETGLYASQEAQKAQLLAQSDAAVQQAVQQAKAENQPVVDQGATVARIEGGGNVELW